MYFSEKTIRQLKALLYTENLLPHQIRLSIPPVDDVLLKNRVDEMFYSLRNITLNNRHIMSSHYKWGIRRFFVDIKDGMYRPYFEYLCAAHNSYTADDEAYKERLNAELAKIDLYRTWLENWTKATKQFNTLNVEVSIVKEEYLDAVVRSFCTKNKYSPYTSLTQEQELNIKIACQKHRLVSYFGNISLED